MLRRYAAALIALAILAAAPTVLNAQHTIIGVKGGLSSADISTDDPDLAETNSRTGLVAGAFAQIGLSDVFAIQVEGLYAQRGAETTIEGVDAAVELDYIEIPLLLKAMAGGSDASVRPGVFAGGYFAFESSCSITGEDAGISVDIDCDVDEDFERDKTDFGLVFGGEVQLDVSESIVLLIDGRYNLGLRDLGTDELDPSVKSRALSIMAGAGIKVN